MNDLKFWSFIGWNYFVKRLDISGLVKCNFDYFILLHLLLLIVKAIPLLADVSTSFYRRPVSSQIENRN